MNPLRLAPLHEMQHDLSAKPFVLVSIRIGRLWFFRGRFYWRQTLPTANGKYTTEVWRTPTWQRPRWANHG